MKSERIAKQKYWRDCTVGVMTVAVHDGSHKLCGTVVEKRNSRGLEDVSN